MARRRIRYISPLNAGKVLAHRRYWTLPFLQLYLDRCDEHIFHEPEDGYLLAQHAPELARRIEVAGDGDDAGEPAGHYADAEAKRSWRVRALAVWGSSCRAYGELTQAEAAYRLAAELADEGIDRESAGELRLRSAVLAFFRYDDQTGELLDRAITDFDLAENRERLASALVVRGALRIREIDPLGLVDSARALELVDASTALGQRTMIGALHNMALAATRGASSIESQEVAHRLLQTVKKRLASKPRSLTKLRVFWVEGLLLAKMGITRLAEKRLIRVLDGLEQLGDPLAFTLAALDLAAILISDGADEQAATLCEQTARRLSAMTADRDLLAVVERWSEARRVSAALFYELQDLAVDAATGTRSALSRCAGLGLGGALLPR